MNALSIYIIDGYVIAAESLMKAYAAYRETISGN